MKTITDYTIYCTKEQTRKALELGAPIERQSPESNAPIVEYGEECNEFKKRVSKLWNCPTAEQMCGWLEEILEITTWHTNYYPVYKLYGYLIIGKDWVVEADAAEKGKYLYSSRKEATLAAIDAALEYLSNNKELC